MTNPAARTLSSTRHLASLATDLHLPNPSRTFLPRFPTTTACLHSRITSDDCHFPRASLTKPTTRTLSSTRHLASLDLDLHLANPSDAGLSHNPSTSLRSDLASCLACSASSCHWWSCLTTPRTL